MSLEGFWNVLKMFFIKHDLSRILLGCTGIISINWMNTLQMNFKYLFSFDMDLKC